MDVTIIIPTTCEPRRAATLARAVRSLADAAGRMPRALVVANGPRVDASIAAEIGRMPGVTMEFLAEGSLPNALRHGVSRVTTPYFGFLDDDDEYLPGAIPTRRAVLEADPALDAVVTNGYEHAGGVDRLRVEHPAAAARDPLRALAAENWLASCGALFRHPRVGVDDFDGVTRHYEWTLLAFKIASTRRVAFVDVPTFRVHDSPGSLSKSRAFREAEIDVLGQILRLPLPADVERALRVKIGRAHHGLAGMHLAAGERSAALRHHWRSLRAPGGVAYAAFTRKLLPGWPAPRAPLD